MRAPANFYSVEGPPACERRYFYARERERRVSLGRSRLFIKREGSSGARNFDVNFEI